MSHPLGFTRGTTRVFIGTLKKLRDLGNTLIVVEHDEETIRSSDHVLDIGPGAGIHGGFVVAQAALRRSRSAQNRSPASTSPERSESQFLPPGARANRSSASEAAGRTT